MAVEVTCKDLETGETQTGICADGDYILITAGSAYLDGVQAYTKTHVLTVKGLVRGIPRTAAATGGDDGE